MEREYWLRSALALSGRPARGGSFVVLVLVLVSLQSFGADAVSLWNQTAQTVIARSGRPCAASIVDMAYVHTAVFDAVNAITHRYHPLAVAPAYGIPAWASPEAAAAAAAYTVLLGLYPSERRYLDSAYYGYLSTLNNDARRLFGVLAGEQAAKAFLAARAGDGRDAQVPYAFGANPGDYQVTPGAPVTPHTPWLATMRPFVMTSASQFRVSAPPPLAGELYARDFNEVKTWGSKDGSPRSQALTNLGLFYAESPASLLARNIRSLAAARSLSVEDNARLFAQVYLIVADGLISTWDAKFLYNRWRPVTAIARADLDLNPATVADPAWTPLAPTPYHPDYPAERGTVIAGYAYALEQFFGGPSLFLTLSSASVPGYPLFQQAYVNTNHMVAKVVDAHVYGGMCFRTSAEQSAVVAHNVAAWVAERCFLKSQLAPGTASGRTRSGAEESAATQVLSFRLDQNYPNPFNPETRIGFSVAKPAFVRLAVFDMIGREVALLVSEPKAPGAYTVTFNAGRLASGTYLCRLEAGSLTETRQMQLVK